MAMADLSAVRVTADDGVVRLWPPADPDAFRGGLAKLASGVAVVACWADGKPRGLLVSSLTGLSTEPPRLLFCVRKAAAAHGPLLRAEAIGVSLLHSDDRQEALRFCSSELAAERFAAERWRLDLHAPPIRAEALATFTGPVCSRIDAGSHTVFILDASRVDVRQAEPLVYFERGFRDIN
jgi:flavin reductase